MPKSHENMPMLNKHCTLFLLITWARRRHVNNSGHTSTDLDRFTIELSQTGRVTSLLDKGVNLIF